MSQRTKYDQLLRDCDESDKKSSNLLSHGAYKKQFINSYFLWWLIANKTLYTYGQLWTI